MPTLDDQVLFGLVDRPGGLSGEVYLVSLVTRPRSVTRFKGYRRQVCLCWGWSGGQTDRQNAYCPPVLACRGWRKLTCTVNVDIFALYRFARISQKYVVLNFYIA